MILALPSSEYKNNQKNSKEKKGILGCMNEILLTELW